MSFKSDELIAGNKHHKSCTTWSKEWIQSEIDNFLIWILEGISQDLVNNLLIEWEILRKDKTNIETDDVLCFIHNQQGFAYRLVLDQRDDFNNHKIAFLQNLWKDFNILLSKKDFTEIEQEKIIKLFFEKIFDKLASKVDLPEFEKFKILLKNQDCKRLINSDGKTSEFYVFNTIYWHCLACVLRLANEQNYYYNFFVSDFLKD